MSEDKSLKLSNQSPALNSIFTFTASRGNFAIHTFGQFVTMRVKHRRTKHGFKPLVPFTQRELNILAYADLYARIYIKRHNERVTVVQLLIPHTSTMSVELYCGVATKHPHDIEVESAGIKIALGRAITQWMLANGFSTRMMHPKKG